ncbi:conserved hypothetical protein [Culex quinquefasciatus]|uniref:Uncharacterized protein n=1 Tax=Culex quinquefasciatus TaxID=7176 RepID=B0XKA2_CULQU|nr:conserved hypothetical protein [Culex quinquefasciatus]|eukprot:XP_001870074.1 conserved hypothetical protein [Culex quinquefasciatus]
MSSDNGLAAKREKTTALRKKKTKPNENNPKVVTRVGESPPKEQPVEGGAEEKKDYISVQVLKQAEAAKTEKKKFRCNDDAGRSDRTGAQDPAGRGRNQEAKEPLHYKASADRSCHQGRDDLQPAVQQRTGTREHDQRARRNDQRQEPGQQDQPDASGASGDRRKLRMYNLLEICTWKGEDAKSQESTELADRNGKESGKKVAAENGARRWLLRNGEKKDPAKDEDPSQKESEPDALAEDIKKPEDEAAPKEEVA